VKKTAEILKSHHPKHVSREVDDAIRAKFPIKLDRKDMGEGA
jgi:hypothetical protein